MLKHISYYKPNYEELCKWTLDANQDALNHKGGNVRLLVAAMDQKSTKIDLRDFGGFEEESEIHRFIDLQIKKIEKEWEAQKLIDDGSIPNLGFNMGIGEYSAFVDGEIEFTEYTSWSHPILKEPTDFKKLPPLGTSKWYKRYMFMLEEFLKKTAHTEAPLGRGYFSPLDLANALLGDKIYTDFYEDPEGVHELMDYCANAIIKFAEDVYKLAEKYLGKSKYGLLYLKNTVNMSEDIATLISAEMYQEFCAPYTQKVIDYFGEGSMHTHTRAVYLVKEICNLDKTSYMWLVTDPNQARAIDIIPKLTEDSNKTYLAIDCAEYKEFEREYDNLLQGNYSVWMPAQNVAQAQDIVAKFKELQKLKGIS